MMVCPIDKAIADTALQDGQREAISDRERMWDYETLERMVGRVADHFTESELKPGDRVAVYLPKNCDCVATLFGVMRAGLIAVPVNPGLKSPQIRHILDDSGTSVLVTSSNFLKALDGMLLPSVTMVDHLTQGEEKASQKKGGDLRHSEVNPDNPAIILYTSGSTGLAMGVVISHSNLWYGAQSVVEYLSLTAQDRVLAVLPLSFDYGLNQVISAIQAQASVHLLDYMTPADIPQAIARKAITCLAGVPNLWADLMHISWPDDIAQRLTIVTSSGGRLLENVIRKMIDLFPNARIHSMYGLTEAFRSTSLDPDLIASHPSSIGRAVPYAEVRIVRPDGSECSDDEIGELVHIGPFVALGYWRNPEVTARRFRPAPSCSTTANAGDLAVWSGDKARRDSQGLITFVGRDNEMIKTSGYRVSPTEVEVALHKIAMIEQAVVLRMEDRQRGEGIAAMLTLKAGSKPPSNENAFVRQLTPLLPPWMIPRRFIICQSLPRNPNGKIDRSLLQAQLEELL